MPFVIPAWMRRAFTAALTHALETLQQTSSDPPPELVDIKGLARLLGLGERTARRLETAGKLPQPVRLGKSKRWRVAELRAWIASGCPAREPWEMRKERS